MAKKKTGSGQGYKDDIREDDRDKDVRIVRVYVSLCTLTAWYCFGANHWAVLLELSNGLFASAQKHDASYVGLDVGNSLREVAILSWGNSDSIRLSCYGSSNYPWNKFRQNIIIDESYTLFFDDCQTFARREVDILTNKCVGWFPLEDGPKFIR